MKNTIKIPVRAYVVKIKDARTGERTEDTIILTKEQLHAGGLIGMTDEEIIYRTYNRLGYRIMGIQQPVKADLSVNLDDLYTAKLREDITDREVIQEGAGQEVGACDTE